MSSSTPQPGNRNGFYLGSVVSLGDSPEQPDDVRLRPLMRLFTEERVATVSLSTWNAGLLQEQLLRGCRYREMSPRLIQVATERDGLAGQVNRVQQVLDAYASGALGEASLYDQIVDALVPNLRLGL